MTPDYHYPPVSSNMATENPSSIDDFLINSSIYRGFSWIFHYHIRFPEVFCQKLKYYLVGGFNPSEKYERSQLGVLFPIYGKLNLMFQTTKQLKHYTIINQVLAQGGAPPVVSWFIIPINYRYNLHKP